MKIPRYLLAQITALALSPVPQGFAEPGEEPKPPPSAQGEVAAPEAPALADFPSLLSALSKAANPRWRQLYRPPVAPRGERSLGAVALGGVVADIYLAAEAFDSRQLKNLCMEIETHSRVLGINEGSAGEVRRLADAAEKENWEATQRSTADLRARLHTLLLTQRDPDLAALIEIGFWLRGLEIASGAILTETEATDLPLSIGSTARLKHIAARIDALDPSIRELPFAIETRTEIERLIRRWEDRESEATRDDVAATHEKLSNLLRRTFER